MTLFEVDDAAYYCQHFQNVVGAAMGSLRAYFSTHLQGTRVLKEGTPAFNAYRDCSLREVERCLFLAASHYRRARDLMIPSSSAWAHVTLYYGSFFSASALLGMFGGWITPRRSTVVEVAVSAPGSQELRITRRASTGRDGPHQQFWDLFYVACRPLVHWIADPEQQLGITPIGGDPRWPITNRNTLNYDTYMSLDLATHFQTSFAARKFPTSLPGALNTQWRIFEALLAVTFGFAKQFGLVTDALNGIAPVGATRKSKIVQTIFQQSIPRLGNKNKWRRIVV